MLEMFAKDPAGLWLVDPCLITYIYGLHHIQEMLWFIPPTLEQCPRAILGVQTENISAMHCINILFKCITRIYYTLFTLHVTVQLTMQSFGEKLGHGGGFLKLPTALEKSVFWKRFDLITTVYVCICVCVYQRERAPESLKCIGFGLWSDSG